MTADAKTILIAGHYGFGNPGDEAILAAIVNDFGVRRPDARLMVVSGNPQETEASHAVTAVSWTDIEAIIRAMTASHLVILGGGGLFHDYWEFDPAAMLTQAHTGLAFFGGIPILAAALNKPVMLYAVGVGPLNTEVGRQLTRTAFQLASAATVRDPESKRRLKTMGVPSTRVRVTADPAFRFQPASVERVTEIMQGAGVSRAARPIIGVALRNWDIGVKASQWERQVASALDSFLDRHGGAVLFVPLQHSQEPLQNDLSVAQRVRGQMRHAAHTIILPERYTPAEKAGLLGQCDLILGMRLHSLIFAVRAGVPAVGLAYDPKVRSLMASVGCEEYALDLGSVAARRLAGLLERAFRNRAELTIRLQRAGEKLARRAHANVQVAVDLLVEGAPTPRPMTEAATAAALKSVVLAHTRRLVAQQAQVEALVEQVRGRDCLLGELQAELRTKVGDRDQVIGAVQAELQAKVSERDRVIAELQAELAAKVSERDRRLAALQTELQVKVGERDGIISGLQAELRSKVSERDRLIEGLQVELQSKVGERDRIISGLRAEMEASVRELDQKIAELQRDLQTQTGEREAAQAQASERDRALYEIHTSRHWKVMSYYWGTLARLRTLHAAFRNLLRRLIPFSIRRRLVSASRRISPRGTAAPAKISATARTPAPGAQPANAAYDVICFPIIDWDFRFQRPQQLLTQFARDGHRCFYVRTTFHRAGSVPLVEVIADRIYGLQLPGPADLNLYSGRITPQVLEQFVAALDEIRHETSIASAVCLVELPFWAPVAFAARERWGWKVIYDCMDEHAGFSTNGRTMLEREEGLVRDSDLVLAASDALYAKTAGSTRQIVRLPNAADFQHFKEPPPENPLAHLKGPIIGYYGAISEWFDVEMVRTAAANRPDWQFVLIGDTYGADITPLQSLRNVHVLGERPYAQLPAYLHGFDVACIPFRLTPLTLATNPVKFYEYLSAGKPVVAVELPELEPYRRYFYPVRCHTDFAPQIEAALDGRSLEHVQDRIRFAGANTWRHRYLSLDEAIRRLYGKATILIVSYNNPDYIRLCLESLWARTTYPNFEVIVVDNGSAPDLVEYLQASAEHEPRLTVSLNGENLGFARANNIGMAAAGDCEYIVLLNDDAVVTRGWLTKMIRYLDDSNIALIGPVTNFAGNEAQIDVDYTDLEEMEQWAQRHAHEHAGRSFDIPMLAMYCVGMRKSLLDKVGWLDERFGLGMFEDDDFSLRVRQVSGRIVCAEDIFVHHFGKASFGRLSQHEYDRLFRENWKKFEEKWGQKWQPHRARAQDGLPAQQPGFHL